MIRLRLLAAAVAASATASAAPFGADDLMKLKRISDPQPSPDGTWVVYTATDVDMPAGTRNNDLWIVAAAGGEPRRLTRHPASDTRGRWSPDGKRIAFVSARESPPQVYLLDLAGGEPRRATGLSTGADGVLWLDDRTLLVTSNVYPECAPGKANEHDDDCNERLLKERAAQPSSARVYDRLLYRHWDTWNDGRRGHLLAVPLDGGAVRDLTPGDRDVPPFSVSGPDDYAVAPDGKEVCFSRKDDEVEAASTNADVFVALVDGGPERRISESPGYDGACRYSPDGTSIAYRSQARAGYESDRWRLVVHDRRGGTNRTLTDAFDRHVEAPVWSADSRTLFFTAADQGREPVFAVPAAGGPVKTVIDGVTLADLAAAGPRTLVATRTALTHPAEVVRLSVDGTGLRPVTRVNDAFLAEFGLKDGESVTYEGALGKKVQAWIVKPASFDPAKKYPLAVLIHGGPQGVWPDGWSYRWNAQVFANAGWVVFMTNPRGSTGWGQEFVDDIVGDWGGRAYEDVMKGTDYAEALPYVEKGRTVAAGASYGGYMVNWIAGHTDRYRALVSHDGVFDLVSMYGATEELWFPEWEFGGPYWKSPDVYRRWSPSAHVTAFKTPTMVIHGEQDHRVPLEQGLQMFTALQRMGVPSRLVVFPDENHWVLKPVNSVHWYREVLGWLGRWGRD